MSSDQNVQCRPDPQFASSWHFNVSIFTDTKAETIETKTMNLPGLRQMVLETSASAKEKLPLLKLARFGDLRTDKNCLRHNNNVRAISGVELDYDGERLSLEEAVLRLAQHRLLALVYTSPRHTVAKPRWRVLLPTSTELPPTQRVRLVARGNGVLDGCVAPESFGLSLSYYYGRIGGNPDHRCVVVDGEFVDLRDDLDKSAIGPAADDARLPGGQLAEDDPAKLAAAVAALRNPDLTYPEWVRLCMAIAGAAGNNKQLGRELIHRFSNKSAKYKSNETNKLADYYLKRAPDKIGKGTVYYEADIADPEWRKPFETRSSLSLDDFHAYMPQHNYIYVPSREPWPATSVNARIPPVPILDASGKPVLNEQGEPKHIKAATWLDQNRPVEQMTWAPGQPMLIRDRLVSEGGWINKPGVTCFNLYRPPTIEPGDATKAGPWLEHAHTMFGDDAEHIIMWLAQRVQRPQEKINHALVFGSHKQGIGKDTFLEPVKRAIGSWNFQEISPQQMLGRFTGFLKRVILRVNEARDLGDVNRYQFYDHTKAYTAAPPDVLRIDEKNLREHSIFNCVGVIFTTNYKTNGIYLPAEDRRHFVAWSDRTQEDFPDGYWNNIWRWYDEGGDRHVAAYLAELDISCFDPKKPPPKTAAFWEIVDANRAPEDNELADVLDLLANPAAITLSQVADRAGNEFAAWLRDRRNRRQIPYRFEQCGYVPVRNPAEKRDGSWKIGGQRQTIYARSNLPLRDQLAVAQALVRTAWAAPKPSQEEIPF